MSKKKIRRPQQYQKKPDPTFKEWWQAQTERTRKSIICALIALAAVIVLVVVWYYGFYDDGSLKIRNQAVVGAEDNWLIGKLDKGKNSEYYKLGTVETPDGYELTDEKLTGTSSIPNYKTELVYKPLEDNGVDTLNITTVGKSVNDMIDYVYDPFTRMVASDKENPGVISEVKELAAPSGTARYFTYAYSHKNETEAGAAETRYTQSLVCYIPANVKNSCVLVSVNVYPDSAEGFLSEDVLVAEAQKGIAVVSIDK